MAVWIACDGGSGYGAGFGSVLSAAIGVLPFFSDEVLEWMKTPLVTGDDRILMTQTRFSCGFQLDPLDGAGKKVRHNYGSGMHAFGHPGRVEVTHLGIQILVFLMHTS
ncbi:hypothetical protein [Rubritalea tangerina]|uniref:hypothetical protein n=1 Tax=Rubritalea tangerina TaxID=430798 RepID=UPI003606FD07